MTIRPKIKQIIKNIDKFEDYCPSTYTPEFKYKNIIIEFEHCMFINTTKRMCINGDEIKLLKDERKILLKAFKEKIKEQIKNKRNGTDKRSLEEKAKEDENLSSISFNKEKSKYD